MIPLIEVIVPCRNAPAALWLALTHLVAHADFPGLAEVTLLDNCSTAPEMRFVLGEARRRGCRVLRNEENVGVWTSVNRGLAVARASWVFVLTADVLLGPMAVSILAQVMDQAGPSLVHLGPVPVEGENAILAAPVLGDLPTTVTVNTSTYNGACFLLRWDELRQKVGWFDPSFFVCFGDTDYAERIRAAGLEYGRGARTIPWSRTARSRCGTERGSARNGGTTRRFWPGIQSSVPKSMLS